MHFQIYIPGKSGANPQHLADAGLESLAQGALFQDVAKGPEDGRGVLCAWSNKGIPRFGYHQERQTWLPAVPQGELPAGRYWIGIENDSPPTPDDLKRPYQQRGCFVTLGDGRLWLLPRGEELPRDMILQDDGSTRFAVQREFHAYWIEQLKWEGFFRTAQPGDQYNYLDLRNFVLMALGINYRMTLELAHKLGLFVAADSAHKQSLSRATFQVLGIPVE